MIFFISYLLVLFSPWFSSIDWLIRFFPFVGAIKSMILFDWLIDWLGFFRLLVLFSPWLCLIDWLIDWLVYLVFFRWVIFWRFFAFFKMEKKLIWMISVKVFDFCVFMDMFSVSFSRVCRTPWQFPRATWTATWNPFPFCCVTCHAWSSSPSRRTPPCCCCNHPIYARRAS